MLLDQLKPYLDLLRAAFAVALLALAGWSGHWVGSARAADAMAGKDAALLRASSALSASADALRAQNAASNVAIAEAAKTADDARAASKAAQRAQDALAAATEDFTRQLRRAQRRPSCAALLASDLHKECGL